MSETLPRAITGAHSDLNERTVDFMFTMSRHVDGHYLTLALRDVLLPLPSTWRLVRVLLIGSGSRKWVAYQGWRDHVGSARGVCWTPDA